MTEVVNVIKNEQNTANHLDASDTTAWSYLLIQSLHEYIDSKFFSSFPWCGCTMKAKQRHKLQDFLSDLHSLTATEIPKNKQIYRTVQNLRLQKLATLQLPAADKREDCVRPMVEIQAWQTEQKIKGTLLSDSPAKF